jgi:chromosome segregation ATPase
MLKRLFGPRSQSRSSAYKSPSKSHSKDNKEKLEQLKIKLGYSLSRETQEINELKIIIANITKKIQDYELIIKTIEKQLNNYKKLCSSSKSDECPLMLENIKELINKRNTLQIEIIQLQNVLKNSPYVSDTVLVGGKSKTQKRRKIGKTRKSRNNHIIYK